MKFSCCTTIDNYGLLVDAGYDRIILPASNIVSMDDSLFKKTIEIIKKGPLECRALNSFCPSKLKLCGPGYDIAAVKAYSRSLTQRAAMLGIEYIGIGSSDSRNIPNDFSRKLAKKQLESSLLYICEASIQYGIDILLEAVCDLECNFITTTEKALNIVRSAGIKNLHIVFDTYHAYAMKEDDKPLRKAMKHIKLVHTAQNIGGQRHYLRRENMGEYSIYIDPLIESGYDGEISVEAIFGDMKIQLSNTLAILKELCGKQV